MLKEVTATGADVNAAIDSGAMLLGVSRGDVQFEILELPRKGFLGLKHYPAKVRVWIEVPDEKKPARQNKAQKPREEKPAREPRQNKEKTRGEHPQAKQEPRQKPEDRKAPEEPRPAPVEITPTDEVREKVEKAADYVRGILAAMDIGDVTLTPRYYEENVRLQLTGTGIGAVIGRRGETLDAIQYLASLVCNRGEGQYIRLSIDSGNYREKRARTLEALARKLANQAVRTGKSTTLEPMNPYERRIIHGAVSGVKGATSSSIGVEPNRRVVISAIDGPKGGSHSGGSRSGGNRRPRNNSGRSGGRSGDSRERAPRGRRLEDPPAIGGPVHHEGSSPAHRAEVNELEKELLAGEKLYGKIEL